MTGDRLVILGCGYVGIELGRQLRDEYDVTGVRRSASGLEQVREAGIEPFQADLTDPEDRTGLPAGDVVVFAASTGGDASARTIYNDALSGVIEVYAEREDPPDRFVYTSSTGVYGDHEGGWIDESTTIYPDTDRQRILLEAERLTLEDAPVAGMDGTVVRFGGLYGPGRYRLDRYLEGPVTEGYLNLVHRDDAAGAVAFLVTEDLARNDVVLAVDGEPLEKWAFADWLAEECGVEAPPKRSIEERLEDDISPEAAHRVQANKRCSSQKLEELGYEFRFPTAREGYRPAIDAYRSAPEAR